MQSKFYQPDAQRAEKVHDLFATIARRYDLLNDLMSAGLHRRWKQRLVDRASQPCRVLDLCCGTGDIARYFGRAHPASEIFGADFTMEMLQVARVRCSRACQARPQFAQADALHLPFPDNSFDVVSVGYGLRNLADLEAGLREAYRVLRPEGQLLSLDFGKPECSLWRQLYFAHLRFWLPVMGRVFVGEPEAYSYILLSLQSYPAQRGVQSLLTDCGFIESGFEEFLGGAMALNFARKPR